MRLRAAGVPFGPEVVDGAVRGALLPLLDEEAFARIELLQLEAARGASELTGERRRGAARGPR